MAKKTYIKAITEGIDIALAEDPKTLVFGEDVGKNGGVFRATNGLQEKYGVDRVFSTPLAESGILGMSIGLAATGWRPVPEIQFMGFTFEAMDSIAAQMSRMRFQYNGTKHAPITIRTPYGGGTHTAELHARSGSSSSTVAKASHGRATTLHGLTRRPSAWLKRKRQPASVARLSNASLNGFAWLQRLVRPRVRLDSTLTTR